MTSTLVPPPRTAARAVAAGMDRVTVARRARECGRYQAPLFGADLLAAVAGQAAEVVVSRCTYSSRRARSARRSMLPSTPLRRYWPARWAAEDLCDGGAQPLPCRFRGGERLAAGGGELVVLAGRAAWEGTGREASFPSRSRRASAG